jgi:hypothetical protein
MQSMDPFHDKIARIALSVAQRHGFALGGGLALIAHGILDRPTEDVDLFSNIEGSVPAAADQVRAALEAAGIEVAMDKDESDLGEAIDGLDGHMVELTAYRDATDEEGVRLSLGHLHRAHHPVVLDIGPVLHINDLRAWKVAALVGRAEARDLVDVGAFLAEHTPDELLAMARQVDPGIEDEDIAAVGRRLDRMPDWEMTNYGLDEAAVAELRRRFAIWPRPD